MQGNLSDRIYMFYLFLSRHRSPSLSLSPFLSSLSITFQMPQPEIHAKMSYVPSQMDAAGFEPAGEGVMFDLINQPERRGAKPVQPETSGALYPVCPRFIANANPTPASKLAFMIALFPMYSSATCWFPRCSVTLINANGFNID